MDSTFDVPDPSDWLHTPVSHLGPVEAALRCQVCKDFFSTPMITSCSHTFCSLCIRRCLTTDGRCPTCRTHDQEIKLRSNSIVQELVDLFQAARPQILRLSEDIKASQEFCIQNEGKRKRKIQDTDIDRYEVRNKAEAEGRRTRSQYSSNSTIPNPTVDQSTEGAKDEDQLLDDGLIACPICNARMKEEAVFAHLDIHNDLIKASPIPTRSPHFISKTSSSRPAPKTMERLPQINYSLLKDNALRKKLSEIGIPNGGPRALLIRRHTEWINLVNANCDSIKPRTKRELLHELDVWDKTQGRQVINNSNGGTALLSVMNRDFDGAAWAASHDRDFQTLIAKARRKATPKEAHTGDINKPGKIARNLEPRVSDIATTRSPQDSPNDHGHRQDNGTPGDDQISPASTSPILIDTDN